MSDVKAFVDTLGQDVSAVAVPRIEGLAAGISARVLTEYGPRVSAFANQLVKDIIDEQSVTVRDFAAALIQELCRRYQPDLVGELRAKIAQGGVELTGHGIKLDIKRQDTGAVVASLDIPVSLKIRVDEFPVTLQDSTIKFDVIK